MNRPNLRLDCLEYKIGNIFIIKPRIGVPRIKQLNLELPNN